MNIACINTLQVCGEQEEMHCLRDVVKTDTQALSFNTTRPMPKFKQAVGPPSDLQLCVNLFKTHNIKDPNKCKDDHSWALVAWWTGRDVTGPIRFKQLRHGILKRPTLSYKFHTPLSPPVAWLEFTSKLFPNLLFKLQREFSKNNTKRYYIINGITYDQHLGYQYLRERLNGRRVEKLNHEEATKTYIHIV